MSGADFRVHRISCYRPDLRAVNCVAYDAGKLAVARADASVEIYSERDGFLLERRVPGCLLGSTEAVCWLDRRLYCTGLSGFVHELDLRARRVRASVSTHSQANWCLAAHSASGRLAVGSDTGAVVLLRAAEGELSLGDPLPSVGQRVLSLAWRQSGRDWLAAGSVNGVFLFDLRQRAPPSRLPLARKSRSVNTLVWCLQFVAKATLVSGDSTGHVTLWDCDSCSQIRRFHSHQADVLSLAAARDGRSFFASGVEPLVQKFHLVEDAETSEKSWSLGWANRELSHDVRAMCCTRRHLATGGTACRLVLFDLRQRHHSRRRVGWPLTLAGRQPTLCCSRDSPDGQGPLALLLRPDRLQLLLLGDSEAKGRQRLAEHRQLDELPLSRQPRLLLELRPKPKEEAVCCALQQRGGQLAYSDTTRLHLYALRFSADGRPLQLLKSELSEAERPAVAMQFSESGRLVSVGADCSVSCHSASDGSLLCSFRPQVGDSFVQPCLLAVQRDLAAVGTHEGHVLVYNSTDGRQAAQLSRNLKCHQPTAIDFHPSKPKLFVVYSNKNIVLYDVAKQQVEPWSLNFNSYISPEWQHIGHLLHACYISPAKVLVANDKFLISIRLLKTVPSCNVFKNDKETVYRLRVKKEIEEANEEPEAEKKKEKEEEEEEDEEEEERPPAKKRKKAECDSAFSSQLSDGQSSAVAWVSSFQFLFGMCGVTQQDVCVLSVRPEDYVAGLEAPMFRKRFGL